MRLGPTRKPGYCFTAGILCLIGTVAAGPSEARWMTWIGLVAGILLLVVGVYLLFREG